MTKKNNDHAFLASHERCRIQFYWNTKAQQWQQPSETFKPILAPACCEASFIPGQHPTKKPTKGWVREQKKRLLRIYPYCVYCQKWFSKTQQKRHPSLITLEHLIPLGWGGPNTENNLALACKKCNTLANKIQSIKRGKQYDRR